MATAFASDAQMIVRDATKLGHCWRFCGFRFPVTIVVVGNKSNISDVCWWVVQKIWANKMKCLVFVRLVQMLCSGFVEQLLQQRWLRGV